MPPTDYAGNTLGTARSLNINPTNQTFQDYIGSLDTNDYYKTTLSGRSSLNFTLNGITANVDIQLLSNTGTVLQTSANTGTNAETILKTLEAGTYYIRVYPGAGASTNYNLTASATLNPVQQWVRQLGTTASDFSEDVATDSTGNVYITGGTSGALGGTNVGNTDAWVAKYSNSGSLLWKRQLGTPLDDKSNGVAVDSAGNSYITGVTSGALGGVSAGSSDAWVAKYNSSGSLLWKRQLGTTSDDEAYDITIDSVGNALITGRTLGSLDGTSTGGSDAWVVKYNNSGSLLWKRQLGTTSDDESRSITTDSVGNVYLSGNTASLEGDINPDSKAWVAKYSSSGTFVWKQELNTAEFDNTQGIAADSVGNIYLSGYTEGALGGTNAGGGDAWIAKYNSSGSLLWKRQLGTTDDDFSSGVAVDSAGNAYISGHTGLYKSGDLEIPEGFDTWVAKYNTSGSFLWQQDLGTANEEFSGGVAVDSAGSIYTTGFTLGSLGGTNAGLDDAFVAKYAQPTWQDFAGNTLNTARNIGTLTANQTFSDWVGNADTNDYYRFVVSGLSYLNLSLNGLSGNADVQLIQDVNSNGAVDAGDVLASLVLTGTSAEAINRVLAAGTYFVRVYPSSSGTPYNLSLSATGAVAPTALQFTTNKISYSVGETVSLTGARVFDANGGSDVARVDFQLWKNGVGWQDISDVTTFAASGAWANFSYSLSNLTGGSYQLQAIAYDKVGLISNTVLKAFSILNTAPTSLQFTTRTSYNLGETISLSNASVYDANGILDINKIDFWLQKDGGTWQNISDATSFTPKTTDNRWANFNYSLSNLTLGNYTLWAQAYDKSDAVSSVLQKNFSVLNNPNFTNLNIFDASGDNSANTVFQGGALRLNYSLSNTSLLSNVRLEAVRNGSVVSTLGTWTGANLANGLINLTNFSTLTGGAYQLRAVARTIGGQDFFSTSQSLNILSWNQAAHTTYGTFAGETLNYSATTGIGSIFVGRGGTDTLNLAGIARTNVASINGTNPANFNPLTSTSSQAIFRGTAFDYLTLTDGREIYFQGIENLRFADSSTLELQVRANDTYYASQWNLHVSDVDSAWRFTQGASNVLLVSLDSGVLTTAGANGSIVDMSTSRLITDPTDDDNAGGYGHGHCSISVMSATANNNSGIAGINWNSQVYVNDVYDGVSLQQAIQDAITYARARNMRVVFQGGIQGEYWLNSGGTQAQLEQLIQQNADISLFAVAAGNGYRDIDNTRVLQQDRELYAGATQAIYSGGVARLQTTHSNVMSVGALERTGTTVNGLANATAVNRASYSNYGSSLTLMAATDSPAMDKLGDERNFNGTSCANPNMAGIASLVWSVNTSLNGGQLRQVLIDTAMDIGAAGRDTNFGNGLVNADAAVRRAWALSYNSQLANLYSGRSEFA